MESITLVEVGARDGLQNEARVVATADKLALIARAIGYGARRIEVASFVHPGRVPQMADAEAVIAGLPDYPGVSTIGLCLNKRGVLRAMAARDGGKRGADEIGGVVTASDGFGRANQGQSSAETVAENVAMIRLAKAEGFVAQVTVSVAFGCPFDGAIDPGQVVDIVRALAEAGPAEIALADTIGVAVPAQVADLFGRVADAVPGIRLRAHFHDTRNTGIANAWSAYQAGVRVLDASLGGLGGCPFAPNATGNIATEDLVFMLERSGVATGIDLDAAIAANHWFAGVMGKTLPSMVGKAGGFGAAAGR